MPHDKQTLMNSSFGSRVAEDEVEGLHSYFVETEQWRQLLSGDVDIVFGAKGAGKSALYSLLVSKTDFLRLGKRTVFLPAENPRGTPAFRDLAADPPASEEEFRGLWKLYFLGLLANYLRHHIEHSKISNANATTVISALTHSGLLVPNVSLIGRLKSVLEYIRKRLPSIEGGMKDPTTGLEFSGKISLAEPTIEQRERGIYSVDELLATINNAYKEFKIWAWLVLDRLDVAFSDSPELEGNALRSLFRVYLDMQILTNVDVKIFLRDDIWRKIVDQGFREASHITKTLTISWDSTSLRNLIVRRLLHNPAICALYSVDKDNVLKSADLQNVFFYRVFPEQVDVGAKLPSTLDWMLSRAADGSGLTAPRELIHLLLATRDAQLRLYELGNAQPADEDLFERAAIRSALPAVSKARYELTLCAENPSLKPFLDKLEREKTQQTPATLAKIWKCPVSEAADVAERSAEAGFFQRQGDKDTPTYWVPFLYRDALRMIQGAA